jgi:hypothetical protein
VADHELDAVSDELVRNRDALLRIGDVVADDDLDLLAIDAAGGVDVGRGLLGALLELRAKGCVRAGDRAGDADQDVCPGAAAERESAVMATADKSDFFIEMLPLFNERAVELLLLAMPTYIAESVLCRFSGTCHADSWNRRNGERWTGLLRLQEGRCLLVKPVVLRHHLVGARVAVPEETERIRMIVSTM